MSVEYCFVLYVCPPMIRHCAVFHTQVDNTFDDRRRFAAVLISSVE